MKQKISVIVWNEFEHERQNPAVGAIYPEGIHAAIAEGLRQVPGINPGALPLDISTATLDQPAHGLSEARLAECDVLIWWGHKAHGKVEDAIVDRVQKRVLEGMGLIVPGFIPTPIGEVTEYYPTFIEVVMSLGNWAMGFFILTILLKGAIGILMGEVRYAGNSASSASR